MTEPPNTEALLATVREAVAAGRRDASLLDGRDFDPVKWDEREAALDAIASELERVREALKVARQTAQAEADDANDYREELERAVEALRYYAERRNYRPPAGTASDTPLGGWMERQDSYDGEGAGARARAALTEIEESP